MPSLQFGDNTGHGVKGQARVTNKMLNFLTITVNIYTDTGIIHNRMVVVMVCACSWAKQTPL